MEELIQTLSNYWVEFLCTLIGGGLAILIKKWVSYIKKGAKEERNEEITKSIGALKEDLTDAIKNTQLKITSKLTTLEDNLDKLHSQVIEFQEIDFRRNCLNLLADGHYITIDEFEDITNEHDAYKRCGGNGRGDALYDAVSEKYKSGLTNTIIAKQIKGN